MVLYGNFNSKVYMMPQRDVALQIEVPERVRTSLRVRAAQDGETIRMCVLRALRAYGIDVDEEDLVDRRGRDLGGNV